MLLLALLAVSEAASTNRLSAFAPFIGACWKTEITTTVADTHCFESVYDGAHVRDRHQVQDGGKTVYAGETIYSADGADIVFTYFNSLGGVGRGTARASGNAIRFTGKMRGSPDEAPQAIESEWRVLDPDHYEVRARAGPGTAGKPQLMTRVKVQARPAVQGGGRARAATGRRRSIRPS